MRKKHQAILISENSKNKIFEKLNINSNSYYEFEESQILSKYLNDNIDEIDLEICESKKESENVEKENIEEEEEKINSEEESFDNEDKIPINSKLRVPPLGNPLGENKTPYIKYQISEKAELGDINFDDYELIREKTVEIKECNKIKVDGKNNIDNKNEIRRLNIGNKLLFKDIIEQFAFWTQQINNKKKSIEIPDLNPLELFKLYPKKLDELHNKIADFKKELEKKKLNKENNVISYLINEQDNIINDSKKNVNKLYNNIERINSITYGDNFSLIELKS